ncbi:MAG: patatin-like phospholipase family protein [Psychrobacter sp.]|uniref:patatin-like phospholipase family protein n=1 Tax=Psychrobacter sp. AOP7-B1-24 TaxID=3457645 RepID=UPI003FB92E6A
MTTNHTKPYERVQLFSGGGSRFGYYLGSYAALVEHDLKPDMIIGTCGGSLAAYLVKLASDPKDLQELMYSRELYSVIKAIRHVTPDEAGKRAKIRYMTHALKRLGLSRKASKAQQHRQADSYARLLDELQQLAMFRIDNEEQWLDELSSFASSGQSDFNANHTTPEIAIIASRLYSMPFDSNMADALANDNLKLQELLFAPLRLADYLSDLPAEQLTSPAHAFASERIHPPVKLLTQWDIQSVVRASMADMYYLPPTHITKLGWCLGGVINLTPIELACQLAETVFAETKDGYDAWLAAPAIKRVFGFDPNARLAAVHSYQSKSALSKSEPSKSTQPHWLPFADNAQQLTGQNVHKRFNLQQMTVELIHADYDGFVQQMQAQWQYGYQRTIDYIQQHKL